MTSTQPKSRHPPLSNSDQADRQISLDMPAREDSVRATINQLLEFVRSQRPRQPEILSKLEILLAEILNNVVEHGHDKISDGVATVSIALTKTELEITVVDEGNPMPDLRLPDGKLVGGAPGQIPLADLPEGGFGWALIRMLADRIGYQRINEQNRLTIVMMVPAG